VRLSTGYDEEAFWHSSFHRRASPDPMIPEDTVSVIDKELQAGSPVYRCGSYQLRKKRWDTELKMLLSIAEGTGPR